MGRKGGTRTGKAGGEDDEDEGEEMDEPTSRTRT